MNKKSLLRIGILFLCMALVAGIYTFGVVPGVRREEQEKSKAELNRILETYVSVPVYNGETSLAKGTVFTEALKGLFTVMSVPRECLNDNMMLNLEDAYGLELSGTLSKGEPLTYGNLCLAEFEENESERLKEFRISSLVYGKVTTGTYIDVTVRYNNGTYDVVLAKKRVYDVDNTQDASGNYTVVLAVTEDEYSRITEAETKGILDSRLYTDELHPASCVTFGE